MFGSLEYTNEWVDSNFGYGNRASVSELDHDSCLELIKMCRDEFRAYRQRQKFVDMVP